MSGKDKYEQVGSIGGLDVHMEVEAASLSVHRFDDMNNSPRYEVHIALDIKMTFNGDIEIRKTSKLRHTLNNDEVEQFNDKGLIRIDWKKYRQQNLNNK